MASASIATTSRDNIRKTRITAIKILAAAYSPRTNKHCMYPLGYGTIMLVRYTARTTAARALGSVGIYITPCSATGNH